MDITALTCCTTLLQPCRRLHSSKLKKQSNVFLLIKEDMRQQKWLQTILVTYWISGYCKIVVVHQEKVSTGYF